MLTRLFKYVAVLRNWAVSHIAILHPHSPPPPPYFATAAQAQVPIFTKEPSDQVLRVDSTVILECEASAGESFLLLLLLLAFMDTMWLGALVGAGEGAT